MATKKQKFHLEDPTEVEFASPEIIKRLDKDLVRKSGTLDRRQAGALVDYYYRIQEHRIALGNQVSSILHDEDDSILIEYYYGQIHTVEKSIVPALQAYAEAHEVGRWSLSQMGIGPVLAAGLLSHIDITKAPTVGHIWRYAGLDPTSKWNKGEKRPWNAELKTISWKIGQSFIKVSGKDDAFYGKLYLQDKERRMAKNEAGDYAELAARTLEEKNIRDKATREAYEAGRLPQGRILSQASRYATKLFLAHWHHVAYEAHYNTAPPKPYIIEHGGHAHYIAPPGYKAA
jgi:hypothetical protein